MVLFADPKSRLSQPLSGSTCLFLFGIVLSGRRWTRNAWDINQEKSWFGARCNGMVPSFNREGLVRFWSASLHSFLFFQHIVPGSLYRITVTLREASLKIQFEILKNGENEY